MPTDAAVDVTMPVRSASTRFSILIASSIAIKSPLSRDCPYSTATTDQGSGWRTI